MLRDFIIPKLSKSDITIDLISRENLRGNFLINIIKIESVNLFQDLNIRIIVIICCNFIQIFI